MPPTAPPPPPPRPRTPLSSTVWRFPPWYASSGGLHANNVMTYFHLSPFFDATSNNGALMSQCDANPQMAARITSQAAFDAQLAKMTGVEYVLLAGSQETGVWVIRKQMRRGPNSVQGMATYYIVGENVYQAPGVGEVVGNRLLTITHSLSKLMSLTTSLSTPASAPPAAESQQQQQQPPPTPASSIAPSQPSQPAAPTVATSAALMHRALLLAGRHGGEYIDDHGPLLGDPGSLLVGSQGRESQVSSQSASQRDLGASRAGTATPGGRGTPAPAPGRGLGARK